ncbi:MAG: hypothetical protein AMJ38_00465 [Dehalococcoidia bacterium DG_22]|nr:MAG: hypothetical protein AMJ38_00465 [Dehalococcoidia bacterium DG_22]
MTTIVFGDASPVSGHRRYKPSLYNCLVEQAGNRLAYNFFSGALADFDAESWNSFKKILGDPNGEFDGMDSELRSGMVEAGFLIPASCDEVQSLRLRHSFFRLDPTRVYVTILPTMMCNFACPYCYQQDQFGGKMTAETEEHVTRFVRGLVNKSTHCLKVVWYGGEPLLGLPLIKRLSTSFLRLCQEYDVEYEGAIITNGYLLTGEVASELRELGVRAAQVTVDGPRRIHDSRRMLKGGGGTFDRIMENLLEAHKHMAIAVRVNVDAENRDSLEELSTYLRSIGLADNVTVYYERVDPTSRYKEPCFRNEYEFGVHAVQPYHHMVAEGLNPLLQISPRDDFCVADKVYGFVINYDGSVYKCWADLESLEEMRDMRLGHVDGALDAALFTRWLSMAPWDDPECLVCKMLPVCLGGCPKAFLFRERNNCERKQCVLFHDNPEQYVLLKAVMARGQQEGSSSQSAALPESCSQASEPQ